MSAAHVPAFEAEVNARAEAAKKEARAAGEQSAALAHSLPSPVS